MMTAIKNTQARDLLTPATQSLDGKSPLQDALSIMHAYELSSLPIVDASQRPIGLLEYHEVLRHLYDTNSEDSSLAQLSLPEQIERLLAPPVESHQNIPVGELMSPLYGAFDESTPLQVLVKALLEYQLNSLLIIDSQGKLKGVLRIHDVLAFFQSLLN